MCLFPFLLIIDSGRFSQLRGCNHNTQISMLSHATGHHGGSSNSQRTYRVGDIARTNYCKTLTVAGAPPPLGSPRRFGSLRPPSITSSPKTTGGARRSAIFSRIKHRHSRRGAKGTLTRSPVLIQPKRCAVRRW